MTDGKAGKTDQKRDRMLTAVTGDDRDPAMLDTTNVRDAMDLLNHVITSTIRTGTVPYKSRTMLTDMSSMLDLMPPGGFADVPSMLSRFASDMEEKEDDHPSWSRRRGIGIIPGATLRFAVGYIAAVALPEKLISSPVLVEVMSLAAHRGLAYLNRGVIADAASLGTGRMLKPKSDPETLVSLSRGTFGRRLLNTNTVIDKAHALSMINADINPSTPTAGTRRARLCARTITRTMSEMGIQQLPTGNTYEEGRNVDDARRIRKTIETRVASNVKSDICADIFRVMAWLYSADMRRAFHDLDVNGQSGSLLLRDDDNGNSLGNWLAEDMGMSATFAAEDALLRGIVAFYRS